MKKDNSLSNKKSDKQPVFTKETLGVVLTLFSTLCLVCVITNDKVFSLPGKVVCAFFFGILGWFSYLVLAFTAVYGVMLVLDKKINASVKNKVLTVLSLVCVALFCHMLTLGDISLYSSFGDYLAKSYQMGAEGVKTSSGAGFFGALLSYPIAKLLTVAGGCVLTALITALLVYNLLLPIFKGVKTSSNAETSKLRSTYVSPSEDYPVEGEKEYPVEGVNFESSEPKQTIFINNADDFAFKSKKELNRQTGEAIKIEMNENGLGVATYGTTYSQEYSQEMQRKIDYVKTPAKIDLEATLNSQLNGVKKDEPSISVSDYVKKEEPVIATEIPHYEHGADDKLSVSGNDDAVISAQNFSSKYLGAEEIESQINTQEPDEIYIPFTEENTVDEQSERTLENYPSIERTVEQILEEQVNDQVVFNEEPEVIDDVKPIENQGYTEVPDTIVRNRRVRDIFGTDNKEEKSEVFSFDGNEIEKIVEEPIPVQTEGPKEEKQAPPINRTYYRPPLDLLETMSPPSFTERENHEERMQIIKQTLEDFHINAEPQSYIQGPSITRYEIMMPAGITVKKVLQYDDDLRMRLSSKDGVRIEAPIPGKNLVGIEVANKVKVSVGLREVLEGARDKKGSLIFAIGKDLVGNAITDDLAKGPHYLIAGSTGSGKSVCLNLMIISMIMRYSPEDMRLILIDPKGVEFRPYEHIPHLMIDEIITEPRKALAVLQWCYDEMERRYKVFQSQEGVVDIDAYNEVVASDSVAKMPRIVVVVDELSNLMETCKKEMDARILALAQKARAAGIHLVLATQRPSVDVITGTIKANLPSRIALKLMSFADSNTIISEGGAEKLLGNGDMLYRNSGMNECERYQGAYISRREVNNIVKYIKENNQAYFDDELADYLQKAVRPKQEESSDDLGGVEVGNDENSDLFKKSLWLAVKTGTISIAQLQRRFQIGYPKAGGLIDKMERMGFISGNEGSKARRVLLTMEEFEEKFGTITDIF